MTAIVEARGLLKRYDRTLAVAGVDLSIGEGEIFGLVGPNGAGKTTMLRMLPTLLAPTAGGAQTPRASHPPSPPAAPPAPATTPPAPWGSDPMQSSADPDSLC